MKIILTLFGLIAVLALVVIWENQTGVLVGGESKTLAEISQAPQPQTLGIETDKQPIKHDWNTYTYGNLGLKIKHPSEMDIKTDKEQVSLQRDGINLEITKKSMSSIESVNTVAEKEINEKISKLGDQFKLLETITPIAIGSVTAVTYTSNESGKQASYFLIPFGSDYIYIKNSTEATDDALVSTSDDIIYSIGPL